MQSLKHKLIITVITLAVLVAAAPHLALSAEYTNVMYYSEQFEARPYWRPYGVSLAVDAELAPDGQTTAEGLISSSRLGWHGLGQNPSGSLLPNTLYNASVYAKAGYLPYVVVDISWGGRAAHTPSVWFDLINGTVGYQEPGTIHAGIEDAGDGWYRVWLTANSLDNTYLDIYIASAEADGQWAFRGDDVSIGTYIWGAQFEEGEFPHPYIQTTNGPATGYTDEYCLTNTTVLNTCVEGLCNDIPPTLTLCTYDTSVTCITNTVSLEVCLEGTCVDVPQTVTLCP